MTHERGGNWINGGGRVTRREIVEKLERVELFLTELRLETSGPWNPKSDGEWGVLLEAGLEVRRCRREVEGEC